jgi:hypothetical protein
VNAGTPSPIEDTLRNRAKVVDSLLKNVFIDFFQGYLRKGRDSGPTDWSLAQSPPNCPRSLEVGLPLKNLPDDGNHSLRLSVF